VSDPRCSTPLAGTHRSAWLIPICDRTVAGEPDIVSPWLSLGMSLADCFWPRLRISRAPGGRIRVPSNRTGEGRYRKSKIYVDKFLFRAGCAWKGGVLVTGTHVWYLRDSKRETRGSEKRIFLTGSVKAISSFVINVLLGLTTGSRRQRSKRRLDWQAQRSTRKSDLAAQTRFPIQAGYREVEPSPVSVNSDWRTMIGAIDSVVEHDAVRHVVFGGEVPQ